MGGAVPPYQPGPANMTHAAHLLTKAGNRAECGTRRAVWGLGLAEYHELATKGSPLLHPCVKCRPAYDRRLAAVRARKAAQQ